MKHLFILLVSFHLTSISTLNAQNCFPISSQKPKWHIRIEQLGMLGSSFKRDTLSFLKDTSFCGKTYHHAVIQDKSNIQKHHFVRADADKVYYKKSNNCAEKEVIIYDFSLKVGDSFSVEGLEYKNFSFKIVAKDSVFQKGEWRRRLKTTYQAFGSLTYDMTWVEGVGSNEHPLYNTVRLLSYVVDGQKFYSDCFFENQNLSHSFSGNCPSTLIDTTVFPMLKDKPSWNVLATNGTWQIIQQYTDLITYDKDTMLCGKVFSRVKFEDNGKLRIVYVRTEGQRVFYFNETPCQGGAYEELMYDYGMNSTSDTEIIKFPFENKEYLFSPIKIDTVMLFGKNRKRLFMRYDSFNSSKDYYDTWIEGIGSLKHPFFTHLNIPPDGYTYEILCMHSHAKQQYQHSKYKSCWVSSVATNNSPTENIAIDVFPNPFQNELTINLLDNNDLTYHLEIYNLLGQTVYSTTLSNSLTFDTSFLPKGTYFLSIFNQNEKKKLVKKIWKVE